MINILSWAIFNIYFTDFPKINFHPFPRLFLTDLLISKIEFNQSSVLDKVNKIFLTKEERDNNFCI